MSRSQIQPLSEATILAVTDKLAAKVSGSADATLARPWAISVIIAASSGVIAGHHSFPTASAAVQAVAYAAFHVKPLSLGSTALGVLFAHIFLTTNGEEVSFAETWKLAKSGI